MKTIICIIAMSFSLFAYKAESAVKDELKVSRLFSDHMVLQQQKEVDFWGKNTPGQKVSISGSWGKKVSTVSNASGKWAAKIATPKAGGPYTITITSLNKTINIKDVLIGEVWLASGQSNMDLPLKGWLPGDTINNYKQEIANGNYPNIRLLKVPYNASSTPIDSVKGEWIPASPQTVGNYSAAAYFYARKLHKELNVPIGIIQSSIGGTPSEAWTSKETLTKLGDFNKTIEDLNQLENKYKGWFNKWSYQAVPSTAKEWETINFSDLAAAESNFNDSKWSTTNLPGRFDRIKSGEFDGAMWLRKEVDIQDISTDYVLKIASIDDMDATYFNGKKVGGLMGEGNSSTPREMIIPKTLLVKGRNVVAIRAIDSGGPGLVNGPMTLSNNNGVSLSLAGSWKSQLIAEVVNGKYYIYSPQADMSERPNMSQLNSNSPTVLFNGMISPLIPYTIKGAIWYQGESNVGRAEQYKRIFPAMITDWRSKWNYEFPFYYVQIAPNPYGAADQKEQSQKLRNAQRYGLKLPKTGMAVTLDIGKMTSAHPAYKQEVGDRLARFALANDYGKKLVTSGPLFQKITVSGNKVIVDFDFVGGGLTASPKGLFGFEVAGTDKKFVPAEAKIENNKVVLSTSSVAAPVYARYAWSDTSTASLFNKEGLPASTFTSEE